MDRDDEIKPAFSRSDYILLLDLLGVAMDRMTQIQETLSVEDKSFVESCEQLEQKVLMAGAGFPKPLAEQDSLSGQWGPTKDTVALFKAHDVLHVRDEDFFWDELAQRLAEIHAMRRVGTERWDEMGESQRRASSEAEMPSIAQHLSEFGIDRMFFLDEIPMADSQGVPYSFIHFAGRRKKTNQSFV